MSRGRRQRLLAVAIGTGLAAVIAAGAWHFRLGRLLQGTPAVLQDAHASALARSTTLQLAPRGLTAPSAAPGAEERLARRTLTRAEVADWLGVSESGSNQFDPVRIFRAKANLRETIDWPEHPAGHWTRVTNGEGAREDHEFPSPAPDVFVLVAGDSHTEGSCDNAESYANLLEAALAKSRPGKSVEVYNTGLSSYSFYNYLGVLDSSLAREPDVFVTTIFAGNDWFEALRAHHLHAGTAPPARTASYWAKVTKAAELSTSAMTQGVNQLLYLRENPDQAQLAMKVACLAANEIESECRENRIRWLAVYLPSALDLPFPEWAQLRRRTKDALGLSDADFELANRLGDQWLATLRERGVEVLDLRPVFRAEVEPLYWSDLHINLNGQRVVARELLPRIEELLSRGRPLSR